MRRLLPLLLLLSAPPALAVERGPHPQVDATGAALVWRGEGPATVELDGRTLTAPPPGADGKVVVPLGELPPGRKITYTVTAGGRRIPGRLWTPPAPGAPFTFVAYGDSRTDHKVHAALAEQIAAVDPDFVLHTGDLVTVGDRDDEWAAFFAATRSIWSRAPIWPVMGNHDLDGGTARALLAHFALPGARPYYALSWGNVRLLMLDSEVAMIDDAPDAAQAAWLIAEVHRAEADPAIDHTIAVIHKGPYSSHPARAGNLALRPQLDALRAAGLDLVISGHDHFYARGVGANGLPYIVLGAGGAPLYPTTGAGEQDAHRVEISRSIYSFARFRVRGRALEGCGVDLTGAPFDCFTLAK